MVGLWIFAENTATVGAEVKQYPLMFDVPPDGLRQLTSFPSMSGCHGSDPSFLFYLARTRKLIFYYAPCSYSSFLFYLARMREFLFYCAPCSYFSPIPFALLCG